MRAPPLPSPSHARARAQGQRRCEALQWTPLIEAAASGHAAVVEVLLRANADVDARTKCVERAPRGAALSRALLGSTALMRAASRGHATVVRLLIGAKPDAHLKDVRAAPPLPHASPRPSHAPRLLTAPRAAARTRAAAGGWLYRLAAREGCFSSRHRGPPRIVQ